MSRGGRRLGSGRKRNSGKFGVPTDVTRLPKRLTNEEQRQAIVSVDLLLQKVERDFIWLLKKLPSLLENIQNQDIEISRFPNSSRNSPKTFSLYRRHMIPVAASFGLVPLLSDFDESAYEEVDLMREFGDPDVTILLTVIGQSMIEADIYPGDELIVEIINYPIRKPNYGDIVIASMDGEVTIKEFRFVNEKAFLVPHNQELEQIEIIDDDRFHVHGIVKKLIRPFGKCGPKCSLKPKTRGSTPINQK